MLTMVNCGYNHTHMEGFVNDIPLGRDYFVFVFFKTSAFVRFGNEAIPVLPNSYILFGQGSPLYYRHDQIPFTNDWLRCRGEEMWSFLGDLRFPIDMVVPCANPRLISRFIIELERLQRSEGPLIPDIIDSTLRLFFLKLKAEQEMPVPSINKHQHYRKRFTEIRDGIYSVPIKPRSVDDLAQGASLSRSYFQHIYKEIFGVSVRADIINSRLEHAKSYLEIGTYTVAEVAALCGYENESHFCRQFKKYIGTTPGRYRSRLL